MVPCPHCARPISGLRSELRKSGRVPSPFVTCGDISLSEGITLRRAKTCHRHSFIPYAPTGIRIATPVCALVRNDRTRADRVVRPYEGENGRPHRVAPTEKLRTRVAEDADPYG